MRNKIGFVAGLFVLSLCGLTVGGIELYNLVDIRLNGQTAMMELADPEKELVLYSGPMDSHVLDVRYVSNVGDVVAPQKRVSGEIARKLAAGEKIPITYLTNNHARVLYRNSQMPKPWVWLVVGIVALATAIYALRLHKREIAENQ